MDARWTEVAIRFSSPIRWVVNTHAHFDHSFGNQRFGPASELDVPIFGHRNIGVTTPNSRRRGWRPTGPARVGSRTATGTTSC
jgi:glyoxylase-like metal-dependent hydrolase (beta-lactamase superfamily II)